MKEKLYIYIHWYDILYNLFIIIIIINSHNFWLEVKVKLNKNKNNLFLIFFFKYIVGLQILNNNMELFKNIYKVKK